MKRVSDDQYSGYQIKCVAGRNLRKGELVTQVFSHFAMSMACDLQIGGATRGRMKKIAAAMLGMRIRRHPVGSVPVTRCSAAN